MTTSPLLDELPLGHNLPSLPVVALEVLRVSQDDDATVEDLTGVLGKDPALSAKVLQMANSPLFSRGGGSITSLQRASSLLGFRAVKVIALGFSLASELPMRGEEAGFDLSRYWHRSLVNAVVARSVAQVSGSRQAEEAFLAGLLADIGKLVLAQAAPAAYESVVLATGGWPDADLEREALGYDSIDVACALLEHWCVPPVFAVAIRHGARTGEAPADASREAAELARVLGLSLRAAAVVFDDDKVSAMAAFSEEAARVFGFEEEDVRALMDKVDAGVAETAAIFDVHLPVGVSYQSIVDAARMQMVTLGLGAAADLREEQARADELESRVCTDGLTLIKNRGAFDGHLAQHVAARIREVAERCLGLIMIDIDHFKNVNDEYGHAVGDVVLRAVAQLLDRITRTNEYVARFGGEEFALITPSVEAGELRQTCERLRLAVEQSPVLLPEGRSIRVTASFGAACVRTMTSPHDAIRLIEKADRQLYLAKRNGRNRTEVDLRDEF